MHRGVADANRAVVAISLQVWSDCLFEGLRGHNSVNRSQDFLRGDPQDEGNEPFHRLRRTETVERLDDEICIAQPAIAIVPCPPGPRRLWYRGGQGGDDATGLLEVGKLQSDGGADDRVLPIVSDRQAPNPSVPIVARALGEFAARHDEVASHWLVRSEHHVNRLGQHKCGLFLDIGDRSVSGEPNGESFAAKCYVVAADGTVLDRYAILARRPHSDALPGADQPPAR